MFRPLMQEKGLVFTLVIDPRLRGIDTDSAKIRQIMKNFLSNALKFTEDGGVTLELVCSENARFSVEIRVHDTGCGIPLEKQEEIFESFRQGDGTTSRKYGGTGLGLTISRQLAVLLGGSIFVQSLPDEGASFSLLLPEKISPEALRAQGVEVVELAVVPRVERVFDSLHQTSSSPLQQQTVDVDAVPLFTQQALWAEKLSLDQIALETQTIKASTLLLIDDDTMFVASLRNVLRQLGVKSLHATNPRDGMMMAVQYQPDGILLSWRMLMSGDESVVLQPFMDNPHTRQIPLKVLTNDMLKHEHWVRDVASDVLLPQTRADVAQLIADLVNGRQMPVAMFLLVGQALLREKILTSLGRCMSETEWVVHDQAEEALGDMRLQEEDGIVVMDLSLSDMSPFAFLDALLKHHPNWSVIVYVNQYVDASVLKRLGEYSDLLALKICENLPKLVDLIALWLRHPIQASSMCARQLAQSKEDEGVRSSVSLAGREILIVDNDVRNLYSLRALLEAHEMKVVMAYSVREALEVLAQDVFVQAVITDIMMPDVNGYELIAQLRDNPVWDHLPIIALTAKMGAQERARCIAVGANDYLPKPVDEGMLLSLLRSLMAQRT